mmetsp:Transcript_21926/g.25907  ORF Transcript_21926/g.25907 Transcript_21926/m.25907 type:complete len:209 (-) Transcript_21926:356-982(-)
MENLKCVIVGDSAVGKSCLLIAHTTGAFRGEYVPTTVFDNFSSNHRSDSGTYSIQYWDTAEEDYDRLRQSYPQTDIFLVCFSIVSQTSLDNVSHKWIPQIQHHCPGVPIILIGTKSDLRGPSEDGRSEVTKEMAFATVQRLNLSGYHETSALHQSGLGTEFMNCLTSVYSNHKDNRSRQMREGGRGFRNSFLEGGSNMIQSMSRWWSQ